MSHCHIVQAEHDPEARPILLSTDAALVGKVNERIKARLATLSTAPTASQAVLKGFACVASSIDEAVQLSDLIGPEHLEIHTIDAEKVSYSR